MSHSGMMSHNQPSLTTLSIEVPPKTNLGCWGPVLTQNPKSVERHMKSINIEWFNHQNETLISYCLENSKSKDFLNSKSSSALA